MSCVFFARLGLPLCKFGLSCANDAAAAPPEELAKRQLLENSSVQRAAVKCWSSRPGAGPKRRTQWKHLCPWAVYSCVGEWPQQPGAKLPAGGAAPAAGPAWWCIRSPAVMAAAPDHLGAAPRGSHSAVHGQSSEGRVALGARRVPPPSVAGDAVGTHARCQRLEAPAAVGDRA